MSSDGQAIKFTLIGLNTLCLLHIVESLHPGRFGQNLSPQFRAQSKTVVSPLSSLPVMNPIADV